MKALTCSAREVVSAFSLITLSLLAHGLACGTFISVKPLVFLSILIFSLVLLLGKYAHTHRAKIILALITQALTHYLLGAGTMTMTISNGHGGYDSENMSINGNMGGARMLAFHLFAAGISYLCLVLNSHSWQSITRKVLLLVSPRYIQIFPKITRTIESSLVETFISPLRSVFLLEAFSRISAPPFFLS